VQSKQALDPAEDRESLPTGNLCRIVRIKPVPSALFLVRGLGRHKDLKSLHMNRRSRYDTRSHRSALKARPESLFDPGTMIQGYDYFTLGRHQYELRRHGQGLEKMRNLSHLNRFQGCIGRR
jgi:hypothetical protein